MDVDCLILGGGITGAGIARDASIRGLKTLLVDSHDFASGTSHVTSKLVHGGLRYLPQGKIRLVIEGVTERQRLMDQIAPHLVRPLRFIVPYRWGQFINWLVTATGIHSYGFLDWWHNGRGCPPIFGPGLRKRYPRLRHHPFAVSYWDAQTNDARLVMSVLRSAESNGAVLRNYTSLEAARRDAAEWHCSFQGEENGETLDVRASAVINATGPWSPKTARLLGLPVQELMWIKGSHILLRRPIDFGDDAIVIRSVRDGRLLWVIPWETRLIVGTTESRYTGDLRDVRATSDEVDDLLQSFRHYFPSLGFSVCDIMGSYAGVRPIVPQEGNEENRLSRRHEILIDRERRVISVNGGKLTTFRRMAEETLDAVQDLLGLPEAAKEVRSRIREEVIWGKSQESEHDISAELRYSCRTEHVVHLLDLLKRRTPVYFLSELNPQSIRNFAAIAAESLGWSRERTERECELVEAELRADRRAIAEYARLEQIGSAEITPVPAAKPVMV